MLNFMLKYFIFLAYVSSLLSYTVNYYNSKMFHAFNFHPSKIQMKFLTATFSQTVVHIKYIYAMIYT